MCVFCAFFSIKEVELSRGRWYNSGVPGECYALMAKIPGGGGIAYPDPRSRAEVGGTMAQKPEKSENTSLRTAYGRT